MSERIIPVSVPDWFPETMDADWNDDSTAHYVFCQRVVLRFDESHEGQSLEQVITTLNNFSDEALWQVLAYRVPYTVYLREQELVEKDPLTPEEEREVELLTNITIRFMRMRSEAFFLLKQRGYDIDRYASEQAR